MVRYRINLQYDGTDFHGWQIQPNALTVEEALEHAMSTILRTNIDVIGCGRTDTGVHASFYCAHFDSYEELQTEDLTYKLNHLLPRTIAILNIDAVSNDFHARFSASSRSYVYHIQKRPNPFKDRYSFLYSGEVDVNAMNQSCKDLLGEHSFSAFCKGTPSGEHYRCTIIRAEWMEHEEGFEFHITANRFLRNMVRAIVGTQLEIGRGKLNLASHRNLIEGGSRSEAGISVPAKGLFLTQVSY